MGRSVPSRSASWTQVVASLSLQLTVTKMAFARQYVHRIHHNSEQGGAEVCEDVGPIKKFRIKALLKTLSHFVEVIRQVFTS